MSLREELLRAIADGRPSAPITDDTPLIEAGVIDSVALFNLMLWIEERTGQPIDPTKLDIRNEFSSVPSILRLVARLRGEPLQG